MIKNAVMVALKKKIKKKILTRKNLKSTVQNKSNDIGTEVQFKFQVLRLSNNSNCDPYLKHYNKSGNWHLLKLLLKREKHESE